MDWLLNINLLTLFDLYLIGVFAVGILIRYQQYRALILFIRRVPDRWPNLYSVLKEEKALFLNWSVMLPILGALSIMMIHAGLYRFVWNQAEISFTQLSQHWLWIGWIILTGLAMIGNDFYMLFSKSKQDFEAAEKQLEQAEFWLTSWAGTAVKVVTFGMVKPEKKVRKEIRKAIGNAVKAMDRMLYYWLIQIALRFLFGFSVWAAWFILFQSQ